MCTTRFVSYSKRRPKDFPRLVVLAKQHGVTYMTRNRKVIWQGLVIEPVPERNAYNGLPKLSNYVKLRFVMSNLSVIHFGRK